ncbi:MAG TPA: hypothetical protein DF383_14000 [Deltaproteobacteria bacterium]|nr:hypothetical protein [Deltaproteobacteria bacterium]
MTNIKKTSLCLCFFLTFSTAASAKSSRSSTPAALPGALQWNGSDAIITLDAGRRLLWPSRGPLILSDASGAFAKIDLSGQVQKESVAEALGIKVEETDLGGSSSGQKKYLSGKKIPVGRSLNISSLPSATAEAGQESSSMVQGVPLRLTLYPNGSSLWKWQWPDFLEEVFFDKRKGFVYNRQERRSGSMEIALQQFADGSFRRQYRNASGIFDYVFDSNDGSYRLSFANPAGEIVAEWTCEANTHSCQQ